MLGFLKVSFFLLLVALGLWLGGLNSQMVELHLIAWVLVAPLSVVIALSLVCGIALAWFVFSVKIIRLKKDLAKCKQALPFNMDEVTPPQTLPNPPQAQDQTNPKPNA